MHKILTAIITKEGNGFVSLCPEIDVASQGDSIEEAKNNLRERLLNYSSNAHPIKKLKKG